MVDSQWNTKTPKPPYDSSVGKAPANPPLIHTSGEQKLNGMSEYSHHNLNNLSQTFHRLIDSNGGFLIKQIDGLVNMFMPQKNESVSGGSSTTVDKHVAHHIGGTENKVAKGDIGKQSACNVIEGAGGTKHSGANLGATENTQDGHTYKMSTGDHIETRDGSLHISLGTDYMKSVGGNDMTLINGDFSVSANGNVDIQAGTGNFHVSGAESVQANSPGPITVTSLTSITFVCGSSRISMTPTGVTIVSPRIDLNP